MTGYLAALAARELGPAVASAVAPRHVGRYEPWATPVPEAIERDVARTETASANDRVDANPALTRAVADTSAVSPSAAPVRSAVQPSRVTHEVIVQRPHESVSDNRAEPIVPRAIDSVPAPITAPHQVDRVSTPVVHNQSAATRDATPEHKTDAVSFSHARHLPAAATQVAPVIRVPVSSVVAPRRKEARDTVREPVPARSRDASPSVVVTIGRIEVRATPAPVASRAAGAAAPTMSLDDYLRERTRGLR